jgi:hypothetical protein
MATFELIGSATVTASTQASITFTSIPSTFTDLCIKLSSRSDKSGSTYANVFLSYNGSTASFRSLEVYGTGSGVGSGSAVASPGGGQGSGYINAISSTSSTFGNYEIYIPNYAGSVNKASSTDWAVENNATLGLLGFVANLWSDTTAITSITLTPDGGNFVQYTTAYLYGVKNA